VKDFIWELGEIEDSFVSNEYDVEGHFLLWCGDEVLEE